MWLRRLWERFASTHIVAGGAAAGMKIYTPNADAEFRRGNYELPIQSVICDHLLPGDIFFDIGANIGFFSLVAARQVGVEGRVYSFEPVASNAKVIRRNAELNGLATLQVFPVAIGAISGPAELIVARHIGGSVLASAGEAPDERSRRTVDVLTLDDAMHKFGLRPPNLIKLDVEGAEIDVLRGAAGVLRDHRPKLIYEVDDATAASVQRKAQLMESLLLGAGYSVQMLPRAYSMEGWHVLHYLAMPDEKTRPS